MNTILIFLHKNKASQTHYQISQSKLPRFSGLLLLAAFPKPTGEPYKQSGTLMEAWVAIQFRSVE